MKSPGILFTPEIELPSEQAPVKVPVKGQLPQLDYPFTLRDLYPVVPSLDVLSAYGKIREEFEQVDKILSQTLKLRHSFCLPPAGDAAQAASLINILFDTTSYYTNGLWRKLPAFVHTPVDLFQLESVSPFPLRLASPQKLIHTLMWIDTNIKVHVENLTEPYRTSVSSVQQIVESALRIYCYLVKQQDYRLARSINFNFSMFLQDRILNLIFGDAVYRAANRRQEQGKLANHIALELLKGLGSRSYRELCTLSVFMGVVWTSREDIQQAFMTNPDTVLANIELELNTKQANWGIDHTDRFLNDMNAESSLTVIVILDDNGESVFDVALFQRLLNDIDQLQVVFVVNRYPVSNNISLETFQTLLNDSYFAELRRVFHEGRAFLCVENQVFRSFELTHLRSSTRDAIRSSRFAYIKGANFFETLQLPEIARYHCFTVYGPTSILLTGCSESKGVFVKLPQGEAGYTYHSYDRVETLLEKVTGGNRVL